MFYLKQTFKNAIENAFRQVDQQEIVCIAEAAIMFSEKKEYYVRCLIARENPILKLSYFVDEIQESELKLSYFVDEIRESESDIAEILDLAIKYLSAMQS